MAALTLEVSTGNIVSILRQDRLERSSVHVCLIVNMRRREENVLVSLGWPTRKERAAPS